MPNHRPRLLSYSRCKLFRKAPKEAELVRSRRPNQASRTAWPVELNWPALRDGLRPPQEHGPWGIFFPVDAIVHRWRDFSTTRIALAGTMIASQFVQIEMYKTKFDNEDDRICANAISDAFSI